MNQFRKEVLTEEEAMKLTREEVAARLAILQEMDIAAYSCAGILAGLVDTFPERAPKQAVDAVARLRASFAGYESVNVITMMKRERT